ncbi:hypothetical protein L596_026233 [Steinernema carpocapsae]|uniref:BPTI/Kunitz inhibitor domain-containing protein n=1 Tax=Steinernema carpocapsae TaxID=34508 RepID=A0A4V5ZY41_STECR|nr:hypothetical protein L596_026233 [Steinernema carpocapsae]
MKTFIVLLLCFIVATQAIPFVPGQYPDDKTARKRGFDSIQEYVLHRCRPFQGNKAEYDYCLRWAIIH